MQGWNLLIVIWSVLSENQVSDLVVDETTFGEVDETIIVEIRIPIVQECQVRHVQSPVRI